MTKHIARITQARATLLNLLRMNPINKLRNISEDMVNLKNVLDGTTSYDSMKNYVWFMGNMVSSAILESENFQEFLADKNQHFDVVIAEWFFSDLMSR